ncbi:MAG: response regulator [Silvanigrellales bacterium]|nr:response regulator [Silvanigrellales bacterium]
MKGRKEPSLAERELVFKLAESLTGSCQQGTMRKDILVANVQRRMDLLGLESVFDYVAFLDDPRSEIPDASGVSEMDEFLSALTIHTTSWFRERPHFEVIEQTAASWFAKQTALPQGHDTVFRVWCAACSTGEEVYSFASALEALRKRLPGFDYEVMGSDIDPVSVVKARKALYPASALDSIPHGFRSCFLVGSGRTQGLMTVSKDIRTRCRFEVRDLSNPDTFSFEFPFHFVICRNVLIYFEPAAVKKIVAGLVSALGKPPRAGFLCLGHSEPIEPGPFALRPLQNCVYSTSLEEAEGTEGSAKKSVLVVDDAATIRSLLTHVLKRGGYNVTAVASADEASEAARKATFDAVTLDINMPGKDGLTWLREQRRAGFRTPVIVLSDATPKEAVAVLSAMREGAQEFVEKRLIANAPQNIIDLVHVLATPKAKNSAAPKKKGYQAQTRPYRPEAFVIGASTGGTEALMRLLQNCPKGMPPVVVVQHISHAFAQAFAERLARVSGLRLVPFETGTPLEPGTLALSTRDEHITLVKRAGTLVVGTSSAAPAASHRPSVDVLFQSCIAARARVVGILLTGMGRDGAQGLKALHDRGLFTCCQDEESSVVYGMPKEAIQLGGASFIGDLDEIRDLIEDCLRARERTG